MNVADRKKLNQRVGALAFGRLKLDEETYRMIVASIDEKSEGHLTRCSDENANLVLLALERMVAGSTDSTSVIVKNPRQHAFIARLMDYLGWNWKDTARFCFHQTGKHSTRACDAKDLSKIVLGMIRIIDDRIAKEQIRLTTTELAEYHHHTRFERTSNSKPETPNSSPEVPCPTGSMSPSSF